MKLNLGSFGSITNLQNGEHWGKEKLVEEILSRAARLQEFDVGPGDIVAIGHGGSAEFFADLFAVWWLGGAVACFNPSLTSGEIENLTRFVDAKLILFSENRRSLDLDIPSEILTENSKNNLSVRPCHHDSNLDDNALILFTSGTTGDPKGVTHSFRSLLARTSLNAAILGPETLSMSLCMLPTHFGHGLIGNCLTPLFASKNLFLFQGMSPTQAAQLGYLIDSHEISFLSSVPAMWKLVSKIAKMPENGTLKQVNIGSAPLSEELWRGVMEWCGIDNVVNMYGITETANWVAGASARDFNPEDGLIGRMWGGSAAVLLPDGKASPVGEGELLVQTPALMTGYFKRKDLTSHVLKGGWLHTGDIGRIDAQGTILLTGRLKDEINRAGIKIQPAEIDLLLERHPDVREACVFAIPDEISGEIVGAGIVLADGVSRTGNELRSWCLERIKSEAVPERWFFISDIPKSDRGKINRSNVRSYCLGKNGNNSYPL